MNEAEEGISFSDNFGSIQNSSFQKDKKISEQDLEDLKTKREKMLNSLNMKLKQMESESMKHEEQLSKIQELENMNKMRKAKVSELTNILGTSLNEFQVSLSSPQENNGNSQVLSPKMKKQRRSLPSEEVYDAIRENVENSRLRRTIEALKNDLREKEDHFKEKTSTQQKVIDNLTREVNLLTSTHGAFESEKNEVEVLTSEIDRRDLMLKTYEEQNTLQDEKIHLLEQQVELVMRNYQNLESELSKQGLEMVAAKETQIQDLQRTKDTKIASLETEVSTKDALIGDLEKKLAHSDAEISDLTLKLQTMATSRSLLEKSTKKYEKDMEGRIKRKNHEKMMNEKLLQSKEELIIQLEAKIDARESESLQQIGQIDTLKFKVGELEKLYEVEKRSNVTEMEKIQKVTAEIDEKRKTTIALKDREIAEMGEKMERDALQYAKMEKMIQKLRREFEIYREKVEDVKKRSERTISEKINGIIKMKDNAIINLEGSIELLKSEIVDNGEEKQRLIRKINEEKMKVNLAEQNLHKQVEENDELKMRIKNNVQLEKKKIVLKENFNRQLQEIEKLKEDLRAKHNQKIQASLFQKESKIIKLETRLNEVLREKKEFANTIENLKGHIKKCTMKYQKVEEVFEYLKDLESENNQLKRMVEKRKEEIENDNGDEDERDDVEIEHDEIFEEDTEIGSEGFEDIQNVDFEDV